LAKLDLIRNEVEHTALVVTKQRCTWV